MDQQKEDFCLSLSGKIKLLVCLFILIFCLLFKPNDPSGTVITRTLASGNKFQSRNYIYWKNRRRLCNTQRRRKNCLKGSSRAKSADLRPRNQINAAVLIPVVDEG